MRWNDDESAGAMNFYSISSDGRVSNWFLLKNKLESEEACQTILYRSLRCVAFATWFAYLPGMIALQKGDGAEAHIRSCR